MSDVFRARLTGIMRDYDAESSGDRDPYVEMEAEVLDQAFADAASTIAIRVTTPAGHPVPWYAAALYFFNTLNFTTAAAGATGDRIYTLNNGADFQPVVVSLRAPREFLGTTTVCIEIPYNFTFHAVVMGVAAPTAGALDPDTAHDNTNQGPGVVFPGEFAWLMVVAPDGSTYGTTKDGAERRIPLGYYPATINAATPVDGGDVSKELNYTTFGQGLQPYTPVICTTYAPEDGFGDIYSSEFLGFWTIAPTDRPDAHIEQVLRVEGDGPITADFKPGKIVTRDPDDADGWRLAAVDATLDTDVTVRSALQTVGVSIWNNGESGGIGEPTGRAAIVTWGRFWLNPLEFDLDPNTTYYLNPLADADSAAPNDAGSFTSKQPYNSPMHRPIFRHITGGWCIMIDSEPSQHLAWAYDGEPAGSGAGPENFLAEMVFDSYPGTDDAEGLLRFRDRPFDEDQTVASGEEDPAGQQVERHDVMAWFVGDSGIHRAFVVKRLDMIFDSGTTNVTGDIFDGSGGWENDEDRPGVLSFFYRDGTRITDAWSLNAGGFDLNANHMARIWPKPGTHGDSDRGGIINFSDSGQAVIEWFVHPSNNTGGTPYGLEDDFEQRDRKVAWSIANEYYGRDCEWFSYDGANWQSSVLIREADSPWSANHVLQTASLAGSITAALPLRIRELTICDDTETERKILVLCSDMYD